MASKTKNADIKKKTSDKNSETKTDTKTKSKSKKIDKKKTSAQEKAKVEKLKKKNRVRVPKDVEVIIMKNTLGGWTYIDETNNKLFRIASGASTEVMTMGELMRMNARYPKILNTFQVVPIDTFDDEYDYEDVVQTLSLSRVYKEELNPTEIEEFILDKPVDEFSQTLDKLSKGMKARVIEKAIELFREGDFNDSTKKNIIIKLADNNEMLFELEE